MQNVNIYDILLCHIFNQTNNNDDILLQQYMFEINEIQQELLQEPAQPEAWYNYPIETLLKDLIYINLEDIIAVIRPQ